MNKCIICRGTRFKTLYRGLLKCSRCGYVFANVKLDEKTLSKIYNTNYFYGKEYNNYLADKEILQKNFKLRLQVLYKLINPKYHKNLLEIGCAYGFFLEMVKNNFLTVSGIDINPEGINYARRQLKLKVINEDFLKHDFRQQKFDVICLWDTIEHLTNPHLYLKKIASLTNRGAIIALTTGDFDSLMSSIQKDKWRLVHPPTHLHYFSKKTLTKILNQNGFKVIYSDYCGFYRSVGNTIHNIFTPGYKIKKNNQLLDFLCNSRLGKINFYLNLHDIIYVIAERT